MRRRRASVALRLAALLPLLALLGPAGCGYLRPYSTPPEIERWHEPEPPRLTLHEKAALYQERLERIHQLPDGVIRYRLPVDDPGPSAQYGDLADGSFFLGIYLASQALRHATTGDPAALAQVTLSLDAMELYHEVTGQRGLIARYVSRAPPATHTEKAREKARRWRRSRTRPEYYWRSDVSKDQYAGYVHGLGVTWAVMDDPAIRARVRALATAVADHLIENDLRLVDWDGDRTTHGNLHGRILGVPIGVNALISLAIAKVAAVASGEPRYVDFYARLVEEGYPKISYWAHFSFLGFTNPVNDNMAYLALYPLLRLETDPEVAETLRRGARRTWEHVRDYRNAFFAFVHAAVVGDVQEASLRGRESLLEFPERKQSWPVDLTREGFDFPRRFFKTSKGEPRSDEYLPLYMRPSGSSLWVGDPHQLVGGLKHWGELEFAGIDYLIAYWLGRHHGFLGPED